MATTTQTPDLYSIPMDELRRLAEEEARKTSTGPKVTEEETETPITTTPTPATEEVVEEEEEEQPAKVFQAERSFDLGEGAGSQVFKGHGATREEALEDLSNKLIEAQKNATKRIKELKQTAPKAPAPAVTPENEALLAAELVQKPSETITKILKAHGVDLDEVKQSTEFVKRQQVQSTKKNAADAFVAATPEYADTERNGKLINKWCELHNDFSVEGMTKAYQDLNESGLLTVKGEEASVGQVEETPKPGIPAKVEPTPTTQRTKKASGLSTHRRTPVPVATELSEEDMYALPLDELRKRANKQLSGS